MTVSAHVSNDPHRVQAFVECFQTHPPRALIANLVTRVEAVTLGDLTFPITINSAGPEQNCYICDPITGYLDYARDELRNFATWPVLRAALTGLVNASAPLLRATGLRDIVFVNNWLLSTNPVPGLSPVAVRDIRDTLTARFPDKVIAMRSLNTIADHASMASLSEGGFRMIPARQIYIYSAGLAADEPSNDMKRDLRLLRRTRLRHATHGQFEGDDFARVAELYRLLYIEKYTDLNPQYTARYVQQMHRLGLIELEGLRDETGVLVAATGLFENGNTLTQPIVGYDTRRPQREGLYRMVMAMAQQKAIERGLFFNVSAGAARFKRLRRAVPAIEFTAVFDGHLPRRQRRAIGAVEILLRRVGIPLLQRFEL